MCMCKYMGLWDQTPGIMPFVIFLDLDNSYYAFERVNDSLKELLRSCSRYDMFLVEVQGDLEQFTTICGESAECVDAVPSIDNLRSELESVSYSTVNVTLIYQCRMP